jgi:STI1 domain
MSSTLLQNKDEWLNEDFFAKMAKNPRLLQAFTNPKFSGIISEFAKNPQETMKKYGGNPEFRGIMEDFSKLMGSHFEDVADKKKREAEEEERKKLEEMKNDPVMKVIESDEKVKEILADPKIQKILEHLRF